MKILMWSVYLARTSRVVTFFLLSLFEHDVIVSMWNNLDYVQSKASTSLSGQRKIAGRIAVRKKNVMSRLVGINIFTAFGFLLSTCRKRLLQAGCFFFSHRLRFFVKIDVCRGLF